MAKKPSKRYVKALEVVDAKKSYPLQNAVEVLNKFAVFIQKKFIEIPSYFRIHYTIL